MNEQTKTPKELAQERLEKVKASIPLEAKKWRNSELERTDKIIMISDWPNREAVIMYRQALRDWPSTEDFPKNPPKLLN